MPRTLSARLCRLIFHEIPLGLAATLLIAGIAINFANVIGRYIFLYAIYWAEEAIIYMSIWSIFLAAIAIAFDRAELTMGLLSAAFARPWKRFVDGLMTAISVSICLFMASQALSIIQTLIRNHQNSLALELPMWIPQSSLLFGFVMIAAALTARFFLDASDENTAVPPEMATQS